MDFSDTDIEAFVRREVDTATQIKIMKSIEENESIYIKRFLKNPMLLSLFILTFQSYPNIPKKIDIFYGRVVDVLFYKHDSWTKPGFDREMCTNLNQEEYINILKRFCFLSYFEEKYEFETDYIYQKLNIIKSKLVNMKFDNNDFIKDLEVGVCLWIEDGGEISFSHKSLQEYFAALYIRDLTNDQKKQVYTKLKNGSLKRLVETDWKNFVLLCENMDKINYYSYFLLPVLEELYNKINKIDENIRLELITEMFFSKYVRIEKNEPTGRVRFRSISWPNEGLFFISICDLRRLIMHILKNILDDNLVQEFLNKQYFSNIGEYAIDSTSKVNYKNTRAMLHFDKKILPILNNETTNKQIDNLLVYLEKKINSIKDEICKSEESENSFIDLI
jgi:hypothetical protein